MKIDPTGRLPSTTARRARAGGRKVGSNQFSKHLAPGPQASAEVRSHGPVAIDPLLAVQEVADATSDTTRAKARAEVVLARLDELRTDILSGRIPRERLRDLTRLVRAKRTAISDPKLAEILDEIELRAEVELTKLSIEV